MLLPDSKLRNVGRLIRRVAWAMNNHATSTANPKADCRIGEVNERDCAFTSYSPDIRCIVIAVASCARSKKRLGSVPLLAHDIV